VSGLRLQPVRNLGVQLRVMALGSSILLLLAALAAVALIGCIGLSLKSPRRKNDRKKKEIRRTPTGASLADPPTITHYGHA